jgi:hypothetical protein
MGKGHLIRPLVSVGMIDPSVSGCVIDGHTTLCQYLLKITIGHGIKDVEKHGVDDHGFWIMRTFEITGHEGFPACSPLQKLSQDRDNMQTAHQTLRQNRKCLLHKNKDIVIKVSPVCQLFVNKPS